MSNYYNIGISQNPISLAADIISVGLAASRASVTDVSASNPATPVAHSVDATGGIPQQDIGDFSLLKGMRLLVFTKISLTGGDPDARAAEAASINGTYILSGGDDNVQTYSGPDITYLDPNVFLSFIVDLT